jgi:hypothetical protein
MKFTIKFPSRGRPDKFKASIEEYIKLSSGKHLISFVCTFDEDDILMNTDEIKSYLMSIPNLSFDYGHSKNKIEAINANLENISNFDILILAADDLFPIVQNYDQIISEDFMLHHPDLDGPLHYMNPSWEERLDIGCIMGVNYYNRFRYIYHPAYKSIFCDNEYMEVAKILGKHKYIPKQLFAHHYVMSDPTANRNWTFNNHDEQLFNKRKSVNFDI